MTITAGLAQFTPFDNNPSAVAVTLTGTTTAGSTLSVIMQWSNARGDGRAINADPVLTGGGLTWNKRQSQPQTTSANSVGCVAWDAINVSPVTNLALSFAMGAPETTLNYGNVSILEIKSADTTAPFEASNGGSAASGTNPTMTTNSASNTTTDGIAHVMAGIDSGTNPSITTDPPAGYTKIGIQADSTAHQSSESAYKILTGAGANSASWSTTSTGSSGGWDAVIVVYKGAGGAAPSVTAEERKPRGQNTVGRGPYSKGRYRIRTLLDVLDAMPAAPFVPLDYVGDRAGTTQPRPGRGPYSLGRYFVRGSVDAFGQQSNTYNDSISEAGSAADSLSSVLAAIAALSETASGADAISAALAAVGAIAESGSASDSDSSANTAVGSIIEAGSAADSESVSLIAVAALTEAASGADSVTSSTGNDSLLSEAASATDAFTSVVTAVAVLSESGSSGDAVSSIATLIAQLSESGSAADLLSGSLAGSTYNVSIAETSSSSDAISAALFAAAAIAESGSATDAHTTLLQAAAALIESGAATDSAVSQMTGLCSLSEVATAIDVVRAPRAPIIGKRIVVLSAHSRLIKTRLIN